MDSDLVAVTAEQFGSGVDHRKGPRRRGEELETAIFDAATDVLVESGYAAFTMERVAARARTSKAALYRRWTQRADLVLDLCQRRGFGDTISPETGSLRDDMVDLLRQIVAKLNTPLGGVVRGVLNDASRDPDLAAVVNAQMEKVGPSSVPAILGKAVARGEIDECVLGSRRSRVAMDLLRSEFLLYGIPIEDATIVEIIDDVYMPLVRLPDPNG